MIDIRKGGIAIYGAVIGAFVFGGLAAKWRKVPLLPLFDLVSLGFLIGQGIGRWGNFVNQEAFGTNTTLPWGMYSEGTEAYLKSVQVTLPAGMTVDPTAPVHPTFLYESIWCLLGFLVLAAFLQKTAIQRPDFLELHHLVRPGPRVDRGPAHRLAADWQHRPARQPAGGHRLCHRGRGVDGHRPAQRQGASN